MKKLYKILMLFLVIYLPLRGLYGQQYTYDPDYGTEGKTTLPEKWQRCHYREACITAADEIIFAGNVESDSCFLIKFDADGKVDETFGTKGCVKPLLVGDTLVKEITGMVLQGDNIILTVVISDTVNYLLRFTSNGSIDNTLHGDGAIALKPVDAKITINQLAAAPTNKYMVTGSAGEKFLIARYDQDGSPDNTFNGNGVITDIDDYTGFFEDIVVLSDGSSLAGGSTSDYVPDAMLAKFTSGGDPVAGFGEAGVVVFEMPESYDYITTMLLQPDGKLLVAGNSYEEKFSDTWSVIARINTDGTPDASFGENGSVDFDETWGDDKIMSLVLQPDNKILAGGYQSAPGDQICVMTRFNANGSVDESFADEGVLIEDFGAFDYVAHVFCVADDKILLVAKSASDFWAVRIMEPGSIIPTGIDTKLRDQMDISVLKNWVTISSLEVLDGQARVTDISGRTLLVKEIKHTYQCEFDLNSLSRGIYFVTIHSGNRNLTKKILLEK
jgi:uncharacterized delta-60 repeat protein